VPTERKRSPLLPFLVLAIIVISFLLVFLPLAGGEQPKEKSYSEFVAAVESGQVSKAEIGETSILWTAAKAEFKTKRVPGVDDATLLEKLEAAGVDVSGKPKSTSVWPTIIGWLIPIGMVVLLLAWFSYARGGGTVTSFGKSKAQLVSSTKVAVNFNDVAGVDEAKFELQEIVDFLRHPEKYQRLGGKIPKGVLLLGPPGTGKTLLAKATAGEAGVPFFSVTGSQFVEMFVGVGAARVRDLFENAKRQAPCIVFIDEIDTIGKWRGPASMIGGHEEREQTLNQLLAEMDGFDTSAGIIIMAATNRPDLLDPALTRGGRFDRQVTVDRPDLTGREAILKVHVRHLTLDPTIDLHALASATSGLVGADLANIVNEAALLAARRGAEKVQMQDFEAAIERVMAGLTRRSLVMSVKEKETIACHETGHAVVATLLPHADPVHKVTSSRTARRRSG